MGNGSPAPLPRCVGLEEVEDAEGEAIVDAVVDGSHGMHPTHAALAIPRNNGTLDHSRAITLCSCHECLLDRRLSHSDSHVSDV